MRKRICYAVLVLVLTPSFLFVPVTAFSSGDCQGDVSCTEIEAEAEVGDVTATTGPVSATNAGISTTTEVTGATTSIQHTEAVRVAPAFGTACYEAMNASLLDKGISIGSANTICQSLQMVDVWFALAAVTEDPLIAQEYTDEGLALLKKSTKMMHRKLRWHNVKAFFQEVGVPVGLIALLVI